MAGNKHLRMPALFRYCLAIDCAVSAPFVECYGEVDVDPDGGRAQCCRQVSREEQCGEEMADGEGAYLTCM
jgi:hypothetical protein